MLKSGTRKGTKGKRPLFSFHFKVEQLFVLFHFLPPLVPPKKTSKPLKYKAFSLKWNKWNKWNKDFKKYLWS